MKAMCRKIWTAYSQFVEKQGFPIIVTVCVAIMTAAAVWSSEREPAYVTPTPPVGQSASAAQILQQSLREAATPSPLPTAQPVVYFPPLEQPVVLRPFHAEHMVQGTSGIWAIHDAVDLQSTKGTKVDAIADGHVIAAGEDALLPIPGSWRHCMQAWALFAITFPGMIFAQVTPSVLSVAAWQTKPISVRTCICGSPKMVYPSTRAAYGEADRLFFPGSYLRKCRFPLAHFRIPAHEPGKQNTFFHFNRIGGQYLCVASLDISESSKRSRFCWRDFPAWNTADMTALASR